MSGAASEQIRERRGQGIVLRGNDIDTDQIIPARYLISTRFAGLEEGVFQDLRFNANGEAKGHPFDREEFKNASILVVNKNFGCGSSREHAPQALMRWGIRAIIGESFGEIFHGNCVALGVPAAVVAEEEVAQLMDSVELDPSQEITLDLVDRLVRWRSGSAPATVGDGPRQQLLEGTWDAMATLIAAEDQIRATEKALPYPRFQLKQALSGTWNQSRPGVPPRKRREAAARSEPKASEEWVAAAARGRVPQGLANPSDRPHTCRQGSRVGGASSA